MTSPSHPGEKSPATFLNWIRRTIFSATFKNTIILCLSLQKFSINILSIFSWNLLCSREKIKAVQNFGGTNKEYYGFFESGLLLSITTPVSSKSTTWLTKQVTRSSASLNSTWLGMVSSPPSSRTLVQHSIIQHLRILLGNMASNMSTAHQAFPSLTERSRMRWRLRKATESSNDLFSRRTRTLLPPQPTPC